MNADKTFFGIILILLGVAMLLNPFGFLAGINLFKLVITVVLAYWLFKSITHFDFGGVIFSASLLLLTYSDELGLSNISFWQVILAAVLLSIGSDMIFPKEKFAKYRHNMKYKDVNVRNESDKEMEKIIDVEDDKNISFKNEFSGIAKYVNTEGLETMTVKTKCSGTSIYLNKTTLNKEKGGTIYFNSTLSGLELHVPKEWKIINNINLTMSGVSEKNPGIKAYVENDTNKSNVLILEGYLTLSGIEIIYC